VLSPLAEATMAIQGDEATLFGCLFLWERLLSVYSSPSHSRSNVYQTVTARFAYMMTEPYVTIAFFAPTVVKSFEGCVLVEKAIAAYLPPECTDECESFFRTAHRPASGRVSFAAYREYLTSRVKPRWPKIATHVWNLLGACPTEACVERGFSFLRFLATDWRSRLEEERVEALLQIPSCYKFLKHQTVASDEESPRKVCRSESAVSQSPAAVAPFDPFADPFEQEAAARDDSEPVDLTDEPEEDAEVEPDLGSVLTAVLTAYVAKAQNRRTVVEAPPPRMSTRRTTDTCAVCQTGCAAHAKKAYVVCTKCTSRASVSCLSWLPVHNVPNHEQAVETHQQLPITYVCERCDGAA
jgi:hypothetical protein